MTLITVSDVTGVPVTHALVIGASNYPFLDGESPSEFGQRFGMQSLTSAARSASEVAAWLLNDYHNPAAPLATIRLLLSPAQDEQTSPGLGNQATPLDQATRPLVEQTLLEFKEQLRTVRPPGSSAEPCHPDSLAFVYIAGHGIQLNKRGSVILLQDFAAPEHGEQLTGAVDVVACHDGLDDGSVAKNQIWFADACRQVPDVARLFERLAGAFAMSEGRGTTAASPLFLASSTRQSAFAQPNHMSLFAEQLLWALRGGAVEGPNQSCPDWHVSATQLIRVLPTRVLAAAAAGGEQQDVDLLGRPLEVIVQRFASPPDVPLVVALQPPDAAPTPVAHLHLGADDQPEVTIPAGWPLQYTGPAGLYTLAVTAEPPLQPPKKQILDLAPPGLDNLVVEVS